MSTSDISRLTTRLAELERRQRRLAWGAACLLPLGLGAFMRDGRGPIVKAEQVELISAKGTPQAVLNADSAGVTLTLLGAQGRPRSALYLDDSTLALLDARGITIATLGGPRVRHLE